MGFRLQNACQVWGFGYKMPAKYGVSVTKTPDFTLKSKNAELTIIDITIIESLSLSLQQRLSKTFLLSNKI